MTRLGVNAMPDRRAFPGCGAVKGQTGSMRETPALVIVYNHRYDRNIETLERLYRHRFSHIYHLMPFYTGDKPNVISVYENSHYFQGYMAQGLHKYFHVDYSHYLFVADDLILNPAITERNYVEHLHLRRDTSFLPNFITLQERTVWWPRAREALEYRLSGRGAEVQNELPAHDDAIERFRAHGLAVAPLTFAQVFPPAGNARGHCRRLLLKIEHSLKRTAFTLSYPLVGSYSDIVAVSATCIRQFCHYCGVFAATHLFVELAVPTALVLSANEIVTENDLTLRGKALWTREEHSELSPFRRDIKALLSAFPSNYLYLHPIKLSQWNTTL